MREIRAQTADHGLYETLRSLYRSGHNFVGQSRNGPVARFNEGQTITWVDPMKRVSQDPIRDANPAFHLFEAFWMLSGENDIRRPAYFAAQLGNYSDDGETLAGAYGHRWRKHFGFDQIDEYIIPSLLKNLDDRRCVLAMWDGKADPQNGMKGGKDLCCNLTAVFDASMGKLNMTVYNRSNDIVWGAAGANVVHFSILQEYVAGAIGQPVGVYEQVSSNAHLYTERKDTKLILRQIARIEGGLALDSSEDYEGEIVPMFDRGCKPADHKKAIDWDIAHLMDNFNETQFEFETYFFANVVGPVIRGYNLYKQDKLEQAIFELDRNPVQSDWVIAVSSWIKRRQHSRNMKIAGLPPSNIDQDLWAKTVKAVWPSATYREIQSEVGKMPAYEAEVWAEGKLKLLNVGMFNDGMVTVRMRGKEQA